MPFLLILLVFVLANSRGMASSLQNPFDIFAILSNYLCTITMWVVSPIINVDMNTIGDSTIIKPNSVPHTMVGSNNLPIIFTKDATGNPKSND